MCGREGCSDVVWREKAKAFEKLTNECTVKMKLQPHAVQSTLKCKSRKKSQNDKF